MLGISTIQSAQRCSSSYLGEDFQHMHGTKKNWLSLLLLLFVLATPITAKADFYWQSNPGGGTGDGGGDTGDPDNPMGPRMAPGIRSGSTGGNDSRYQVNRPMGSGTWVMRRYLTMLSGLRSFYLRF